MPGFATLFFGARGFRMTSPFGLRVNPLNPKEKDFHGGIDYGGQPRGKPVDTPAEGVVFAARKYRGWGNLVAVKDRRDYNHLFAHLDSIRVFPGQRVARGDIIGTVGSTGATTGPHLHYQINRPGAGVRGDGYFGNPDEYVFDEVKGVERAIVIGSEADYFNAAPLRDKLDCPVFARSALGLLGMVQTVYICGGPEEEVAKSAPEAKRVNLSGRDRFETAAKIWEYLGKL